MAAARTKRIARRDYLFNKDDRISILPDDVLLKILEKLPVEEARMTSLLARRWKNLWKLLSNVKISDRMKGNGEKKVSAFLKSFIRLYQGNRLKCFSASLKYEGKRRASYKSWITFAVSYKVEELSLELNLDEYNWPRSQHPTVPLPVDLFSCGSLIRVKLTFADLNPLPPLHLKSVRYLHLSKSRLPEDGIETVTANCPLLQHLVLSNCNRDRELKISVSTDSILSRITIDDADCPLIHAPNTSINAPNITALDILCGTWMRRYFIGNVPNAVEARLCFTEPCLAVSSQTYESQIAENIAELLKSLQVAKMLHLCARSILSVIRIRRRYSMLTLTHLVLDTRLTEWEILGIVRLLRACPVLQQLVICITGPDCVQYPIRPGKWGKLAFCLEGYLQSLAVLEFKNLEGSYQAWADGLFEMKKFFRRCTNGIQMVKLLLLSRKNLDRIAFTTSRQQCELIGCTY